MAVFGNSSSAQADNEASDLAVRLDTVAYIALPFARVDISITNNGGDPLQSATVMLRADRPMFSGNTPCTVNSPNSTLTCQFGALPVGATATASSVVSFSPGPDEQSEELPQAVRLDGITPRR